MTNENLMDQSFDSTETIWRTVRGLRTFLNTRLEQIENAKPPEDSKGAALQQFKAYRKGAKDELLVISENLRKCGF